METPLTIQKPEEHEPTIEELMLDVEESIRARDAKIKEQRQQLEDVRDALKGLLNVNKCRVAPTQNVQGIAYENSTREDAPFEREA